MWAVIAIFLLALYFAPSIVAACRDHPKETTLFLLNLSFGWTVIGWVALMIWAWSQGHLKD